MGSSTRLHGARDTLRFLRDEEGYENGYGEVDVITQEKCPTHTPELKVMDYSVWSILKATACSKPHKTVEASSGEGLG
jgi:hypothetical protein